MRRFLHFVLVAFAITHGVSAAAANPPSIEVVSVAPAKSTVTFSYRPERAEAKVFVAGDFNGWNPTATPMERMGDGYFRATVEIADGRHGYKFVVDGKWISDPLNPTREPDGHDGFNSVLVLGKGGADEPTEQRVVEGFATPDWARDAIWYQIMLDRFANGDPSNDIVKGTQEPSINRDSMYWRHGRW